MIHNMYNPDPNERSSNEDSDEFREYQNIKDELRIISQEMIFTLDNVPKTEHDSLYEAIEAMEPDEKSKFRDLEIKRRHLQHRLEELRLDLESQNMGGFI